MRTREVYIEDSKTLAGTSGSATIDLSLVEGVSCLMVGLLGTNKAAGLDDAPIQTKITKIELIDGSDVLYSQSGNQACANACFDTGKYPQCMYSEYVSQPQSVLIPILFGRYIGDPDYFLDPKKFRNLQIRFQWNIGTDLVSGTGRLTIIARVLPGAVTSKGFFMTKEAYGWNTAVGGKEPINLPLDFPYRRLMIRAYVIESGCGELITKMKLSADKDREVIFNLSSEELAAICHDTYGEFELVKQDYMSDGDTRQLWIDSMLGGYACNFGQISVGYRGIIGTINNYGHGKYTVELMTHGGASASNVIVYPRCHGCLPENTFGYSFGHPDVEADWLDVTKFESLMLHTLEAKAIAAGSVSIQQLRR